MMSEVSETSRGGSLRGRYREYRYGVLFIFLQGIWMVMYIRDLRKGLPCILKLIFGGFNWFSLD